MGKKKDKEESIENVTRIWHPDMPIEITGMNEEQIKRKVTEFLKNKEQKNT